MQVNSQHQQLTTDEIVENNSVASGSEYSPLQNKAMIMAEIHMENTLSLMEGNTLFILHQAPNNESVGVFKPINADVIQNYVKNMTVFIQACKSMGFKVLALTTNDEDTLNVLKSISENPPFANMQFDDRPAENGKLEVAFTLGDDQQSPLSNPRGRGA